jgi:hypothetical protein
VLHGNDWASAVRTYLFLFDNGVKTLLARRPVDIGDQSGRGTRFAPLPIGTASHDALD